jgi:hypothetical protein
MTFITWDQEIPYHGSISQSNQDHPEDSPSRSHQEELDRLEGSNNLTLITFLRSIDINNISSDLENCFSLWRYHRVPKYHVRGARPVTRSTISRHCSNRCGYVTDLHHNIGNPKKILCQREKNIETRSSRPGRNLVTDNPSQK